MSWWRLPADDLGISRAAASALHTFKNRGPVLRRAAMLCALGDALTLQRPPRWAVRARRAYEGAQRRLDDGAGGAAVGTLPAASDPGARAHAALRAARDPYHRLAAVLTRASLLALGGLAALALLAAVVSPAARAWLRPPDLGATAAWVASSALEGAAPSGDSTRAAGPYFVHTQSEERPYVDITLPRAAKVRKIRIWNRTDCCQMRTLPLNVEVPDGDGWRLLCQRRSPFSSWTCRPDAPVATNRIRIQVPQQTMLHLKRVAVYE